MLLLSPRKELRFCACTSRVICPSSLGEASRRQAWYKYGRQDSIIYPE